jgi:hypothetical protein
MGYKPDHSDLGAPNSVNRVRHLRLGVGEKITAPDGKESRILILDTWNTDIVSELEPQAGEATGNLEVRPECHALRIEHGKSGKVTGVV